MRTLFKAVLMLVVSAMFTAGILAQNRSYQTSDQQVRILLNSIQSKTYSFRRQMQNTLDRSTYNNTNTEDMFNGYLNDFENSTNNLKSNINNRTSTANDAQQILNAAAAINNFMQTTRLNITVQNQWTSLRNDLNTLSRYYNISWNWNTTTNSNSNSNSLAYTSSYANVQNVISSLERNTNSYKNELSNVMNRGSLNNTRSRDSFNNYVRDFENATDALKTRFQAGNSTDSDVESVLNKGYMIDSFMRDYQLNYRVENQWNMVRKDLDTLAGYYAVSMNWNQPKSWNNQYDTRLDGTYRLNASMSDNVENVVQSVTNSSNNSSYNGNQNDRISRNLQRRLSSPEYLAIDKNGNSVTIASTGTAQATFQADGVPRNETMGNRQVTITGKTYNDSITLSYEADKMNDYYVSFMPMSDGRLKVVRRVNLENRNETVAVASVYDKVNNVADFSWVARQENSVGQNNNNGNNGSQNTTFYIPNGTRIEGTLNESLSTKTVNDGDKFSINVTYPSNYAGATIYGYVSGIQRSGRVSGRANMTFNFDQIRLNNGTTYNFKGIVEQVSDKNGNKISVNNEGVVRDGNQTTKTVVRSGIGAGIGAILGAIINGGEGAAVGAAIGGGVGAGSVIAQGRDDLNLDQGSQIVISSTSPSSVSSNR